MDLGLEIELYIEEVWRGGGKKLKNRFKIVIDWEGNGGYSEIGEDEVEESGERLHGWRWNRFVGVGWDGPTDNFNRAQTEVHLYFSHGDVSE